MKPIRLLIVISAILIVPALASAQGYNGGYGRGEYGFHHREGRLMWGVAIGLGGLHEDGQAVSCDNCNTGPALEVDGHIGGMIGPRFALMFEAQANGRTIHSDAYNGDTTYTQTAAMIAGQFWLTPQLWIKGGLGVAGLQTDDTYVTTSYGTGGAIMGAIGFEIMSARFFAIDLQGRVIEGTYNSGNDNVTAANVGIGLNWY